MPLVFFQHIGGHPYTHIGDKLKPLLASDSPVLRVGEHVCGVVRVLGEAAGATKIRRETAQQIVTSIS